MSAASNYTENNTLNAALRGVAYPLPTGTYVSLHTADPADSGTSEVSTESWPAYVRKHAEAGGAIGTGWSESTAGESKNANQIVYPSYDGAGTITITHFGVWDASTAGNLITYAALDTPRTIAAAEVLVFDINSLTVTMD